PPQAKAMTVNCMLLPNNASPPPIKGAPPNPVKSSGPQRGSNTIQSARNAGGFGRGAWLRGRKAARKLDSQSPSQTRLIQASFSQRPSAARGRPTRRVEVRGMGVFLARVRSEFRPRHDDNIPGPAAPKRGRGDEAAFQIPR